jgi:hypothetical protein
MTHTWKLPECVNPKSLSAANMTRPTRSIGTKGPVVFVVGIGMMQPSIQRYHR